MSGGNPGYQTLVMKQSALLVRSFLGNHADYNPAILEKGVGTARKNRDLYDECSEYECPNYGHSDLFEYEDILPKNFGNRQNRMKSSGRDDNRKSGIRRKRNISSAPPRQYDEDFYCFDDDF